MAVASNLQYAPVSDLYLDPHNPRLGRRIGAGELSQEAILEIMQGWDLEELAASFLQSGFWPQEAVIVSRESLYGDDVLVVIEGNRRVAALKRLQAAQPDQHDPQPWGSFGSNPAPEGLFERVPYLLADNRDDVDLYLGFRHVTGIKEWKPAEKAQYISHLVDNRGYDFRTVTRAIGSRIDAVQRNYLAYRVLLQIDELGSIAPEAVERRFSVHYLALRESGVRAFLGVTIPSEADGFEAGPVDSEHLEALEHYATWLFGSEAGPPLFTDSRRVGEFGRVLADPTAVAYLTTSRRPDFEVAVRHAGADIEDLLQHVRNATDEVELALSTIHRHRGNEEVEDAVDRFDESAKELVARFKAPAE